MLVRTCPELHVLSAISFLTLAAACPDDAASPATTASPGQPGEHEPATTSFGPNEPTPTTDPTAGATTDVTSTGASTTDLDALVCGDGHLDPGEACDHGTDNANSGACTLECKLALCGDGLVWAGVEACDFGLGNADVYGGCRPEDCQFAARCGDGVLDVERHWTSYQKVLCAASFRLYCFDDGFIADEQG